MAAPSDLKFMLAQMGSQDLAERVGDYIVSLDTRLTAEEAKSAAEGAEDTDWEIPLNVLGGIKDSGTWAAAMSTAGAPTVTRTAGAATEGWWMDVTEAFRQAASRGLKVTGVRTVYTVGTADADDIRTELYRRVLPADNAAMAAATLVAGDDNVDYDAAHNTAAERGDDTAAPELHTMTMTVPVADQAYQATGQEYSVKFVVVDPGTSVVILKAMHLLCSKTLIDQA